MLIKEEIKEEIKECWLARLRQIEQSHKGDSIWITSNEAVELVEFAKDIFSGLYQ